MQLKRAVETLIACVCESKKRTSQRDGNIKEENIEKTNVRKKRGKE